MAAPTTPNRPRPSPQAPPTTMPRSRSTSKPDFDSSTHEERSKDLVTQTSRYELHIDTFLKLLPNKSDASKLNWGEMLADARFHKRFVDAFQKLPGSTGYDKSLHEDVVFAQMHTVYSETITVCQERGCGEHTFNRPDGQICPHDSSPDPEQPDFYPWDITAVIAEYKKEATTEEVSKNVQQCVWGLVNEMWQSPDRLYAWGITIEETNVRLWIAHRSGIYVSTPFHLHKQKHHLLHALSCFAYAGRDELGWDTAMNRVAKGTDLYTAAQERALTFKQDRPHERGATKMRPLEITVQGKSYVAVAIIADHRARGLDGSGCRVLAAYRSHGKVLENDIFALKIVWRSEMRKPEGEIYNELMDAIDRQRDLARYFVEIVAYSDDGNPNPIDIANTIMHGIDLSQARPIPTTRAARRRDEMAGSHYTPWLPNSEAPGGRRANPRTQNRVYSITVMKYAGEPMHHRFDRGEICKAHADIIRGLKIMAEHGYNHRDCSTGNFMVDDKGNGRLGDLEFAKVFESKDAANPDRTGTPDFMATEVTMGQHTRVRGIEFRYNPTHDLESVLRTFIHQLLVTADIGAMDPEHFALQRQAKTDFFN
ncbi:hypothetical protein CALVIDRAFT_47208 [Calocera viscosa TUFC12733]|uniref:Protein kinase domain-containing protein n=1 Tax=Calocera viscosa (strain TUFC12733) TaxID=1330018 RepID=A0A167FJY9_CALVF|nr:hypothetical protein CALVIDRAFT_47208 [Calocera viscosa TUFC12733]